MNELPNFLKYIETTAMQFSYKMVFLYVLISQGNQDGSMKMDDLVKGFTEFYVGRINKGLKPDLGQAAVSRLPDLSPSAVKDTIRSGPLAYIKKDGWLETNNEGVSLQPSVWAEIRDNQLAKARVLATLEQRLTDYYVEKGLADHTQADLFRRSMLRVLNEYPTAKTERFAGHPMQRVMTEEMPRALENSGLLQFGLYKLRGSVGQGNWASVPWFAVMNRQVTETTQKGIYLVYLFAEDMSSAYLTLMFGVTDYRGRANNLAADVGKLRSQLELDGFQVGSPELGSSSLAQQYSLGTIGYIRYQRDSLPTPDALTKDLIRAKRLYGDALAVLARNNEHKGEQPPQPKKVVGKVATTEDLLKSVHTYLGAKGFQYSYSDLCNFYLSLRTKPFVILAGISGTGKSKLPQLFAEASGGRWHLIPVRPDWNDSSDLMGYLDLTRQFRPGRLTEVILQARKEADRPHIVILDEMNLARVEHYLADWLSIIETRQLVGEMIETRPFFEGASWLRDEGSDNYRDLTWPPNLYLVGTVNMDETTHPFSRKVLDRANTIEFNQVDLRGYQLASDQQSIPTAPMSGLDLSGRWMILQDVLGVDPTLVERVIDRLVQINEILASLNMHFGYRVRDEVVIYMMHNQAAGGLLTEDQAFDYQVMQKILPRIQGSQSKLQDVLEQLRDYCDREHLPSSLKKLQDMLQRFEEDGFTSYWI